jgi:aspartate racemase
LRKLGLIGGISWVSTALYYEAINKGVARRRGGTASAPLLIESLDLGPVAAMQHEGRWDDLSALLSDSARRLAGAGAEGLIICSNTGHKCFGAVAAAAGVPMLHIGEVVAARLEADGVKRAGLIGTRFTMAEPYISAAIEARGIGVTVPDAATRTEIDRIIYEELVQGQVLRSSQRKLKTCLTNLSQAKAQAVVLGCTELAILVDPGANVLPIYDTTAIHAAAAVDWILGEDG